MAAPTDPGECIPGSGTGGVTIDDTYMNRVRGLVLWAGSGSSTSARDWVSWTPQVTQSGALTESVTRAYYYRHGDLVVGYAAMGFSNTGTAGNAIIVSLPVTMTNSEDIHGGFTFYDFGNTIFAGVLYPSSTTGAQLVTSGQGQGLGITPSIAIATSDTLRYWFVYEAP